MAQVRYIVDDVDKAVGFYVSNLDFRLEQQYGPAMAILVKADSQLWPAGVCLKVDGGRIETHPGRLIAVRLDS